MATYSNRIRELRLARSLNQEQLAEKIGLTKQAISQYERGVRKPSFEVIEALCDFFNVSSDYLLGKDDVTIRFVDIDDIKKLDSSEVPISGQTEEYYLNKATAELTQELLTTPGMRVLFKAARGSREEDIQMAADLLNRLKETNKDG